MKTDYSNAPNSELNREVAKRQGWQLNVQMVNEDSFGQRPNSSKIEFIPRPADDANDAISLLAGEYYQIEHFEDNKFRVKLDYDQAPEGVANTLPRAMTIAWLQWGDFKAND